MGIWISLLFLPGGRGRGCGRYVDHFRGYLCGWRDLSSCDEHFMETRNYLEIKQGLIV